MIWRGRGVRKDWLCSMVKSVFVSAACVLHGTRRFTNCQLIFDIDGHRPRNRTIVVP